MKREKQTKFRQALGIMVLITALGAPLSSLAAPAGTVVSNPLVMGRTAFSQKNYAKAADIYRAAASTDKYKNNIECRLGLGKALYNLGTTQQADKQTETYKQAIKELRTALRMPKGTKDAVAAANEANNLLSKLPARLIAPRMGADTPMIALANGLRGMERGGEPGKPKVLEFYASWCEPCKQLKPILDKAKADYKDKVDFISYDIDKPQTEKVLQDYEVSPIPTLIFLDSNNQVVSYSIGYSGETGLKVGIKKILPPV